MKFNIEVECTPEEVRRLVGLPDLTEVHEVYLDKVKDVMTTGLTPDIVDTMVRSWVPGGAAGMDFVKDLVKGLSATPSTPKKKD